MGPGQDFAKQGDGSALDRLRRDADGLFEALARSGLALVATDPHLPDNPIVFANDAFTGLTGYAENEVAGRNCRFLQGARTDAAAIGQIRDAIAAGRQIQTDLLNQRKDGSQFWNRLTITPVREGGQVVLHLATLADVTSQHGNALLSGAAGLWDWDVPAERLYADARFADLYGIEPRNAFLGLAPDAFFAPVEAHDRMRLRIAIAGVMNGVEVFSRDYRIVRQDGSIRWVSARGRAQFDELGRPLRFSGLLADVTDQKRLEEQLRVAQTAGGVGSFEYACGFGTATVSDEFCRLLGLNRTDALPVRTINAVVEGKKAIIEPWDDTPAGPLPYTEIPILTANTGEQRWLARRGDLIHEAVGCRFVGVIYDITAAKTAEAKLRELTQILEERVTTRTLERDLVWTRARDLFTVTGPDGLLRSINPAVADVLGYQPEELVGERMRALVHPDDEMAVTGVTARLAKGEPINDFTCRLRGADGEYRWFSWNVSTQDGQSLGVGRDITQRKALEDQLRQSQKMEAVGQLTGGLAHDFNNMLAGIMGSLDLMRRRIAQGRYEETGRFIDAATSSAERAAGLVHRLLAFSRRQSLESRAIDVAALIMSMSDLLRRTLGEQISLKIEVEPSLGLALSDPNQLESAILNLAINARDAMPDGGVLTIRADKAQVAQGRFANVPAGDFLRISVGDTGAGMPEDIRAKAFDPFFTTKPIGQGTGLGLSMIYGFLQQSGGQVEIESPPGAGATIHLYLPRLEGDAAPLPEARTTEALHGSGESILVVEDDVSVRMLVMETLHDLGYLAVAAPDADAALPILRAGATIDLLVTDVGLPGMNGRQLADVAREAHPNLRVLFMTGYAEKASVRSEFLGENMSMIAKPFSIEAFAAEIRRILD